VWTEAAARAFWISLDRSHNGGRQKKLLEYMMGKDGRATPDEVLKHLKIDNEKLRGVLANITRNARRETGYKKAKVVDWANDKGGYYFILDSVLGFLKEID
jgi:hypothetical protein